MAGPTGFDFAIAEMLSRVDTKSPGVYDIRIVILDHANAPQTLRTALIITAVVDATAPVFTFNDKQQKDQATVSVKHNEGATYNVPISVVANDNEVTVAYRSATQLPTGSVATGLTTAFAALSALISAAHTFGEHTIIINAADKAENATILIFEVTLNAIARPIFKADFVSNVIIPLGDKNYTSYIAGKI